MNIQHFEKGLQYSADELLLIAKKLGKLATYCEKVKDEASVIRIESERRNTKKDRDQVKVKITVKLPGDECVAESRRRFVIDAVDRCMEKLKPQLERYKEMHSEKARARKKAKAMRKSREQN